MTPFARRRAPRVLLLLALLALARVAAQAQDISAPAYKISYRISMPQPASHLFEVQLDVRGLAGADHVDFQMPRWSPGRYAVFDFAKNVQEVKAANSCPPEKMFAIKTLPVERLDTQTWRVSTEGSGCVNLFYKVFADDLSARSRNSTLD